MATTPKWKYKDAISFTKPTRSVSTIFLHCSASDNASHDDISVMRNWHMEGNGWSRVGYHFFINKNGNIQEGCDIEKIPIAQKGHNTGSIAICCHGLKKEKFTEAQMDSVKALCKAITAAYTSKLRIRGHCEVSSKSCPVYDYKKVLGLDSKGYLSTSASGGSTGGSTDSPKKPPVLGAGKKAKIINIFDKGALVVALQKLLCRFGIECTADGIFGKNTQTALKALQKRKGAKVNGSMTAACADALFSSRNVVLKVGARNRDVAVLQLLLALHGQNLIHDGIFGKGTFVALKAVQGKAKLNEDGIFGPKTRAALCR